MADEPIHPCDDPRYEVQRTDAQWRARLDPLQYQVARHGATERPFSGRWWSHFQPGHYACIGCGAVLFADDTKFDAGCGWPSWWAALPDAPIEELRDTSHGMERVEVRCRRCGSHLGHVFPDGPAPTGQRYCINSASVGFEPKP